MRNSEEDAGKRRPILHRRATQVNQAYAALADCLARFLSSRVTYDIFYGVASLKLGKACCSSTLQNKEKATSLVGVSDSNVQN